MQILTLTQLTAFKNTILDFFVSNMPVVLGIFAFIVGLSIIMAIIDGTIQNRAIDKRRKNLGL